ncbi:putative Zinc metalloproteinase nas-13 [Hypsibius exemplaris]|uniref:Metalloendopeptidase n=1 Tax=Hypsibius exemplaris TaxID=2072580 RepID=A0A9X6NJI5_HYPEX|nr:putative Zinc metalloproteinase nas-13 [Hypsibius exemplaris]
MIAARRAKSGANFLCFGAVLSHGCSGSITCCGELTCDNVANGMYWGHCQSSGRVGSPSNRASLSPVNYCAPPVSFGFSGPLCSQSEFNAAVVNAGDQKVTPSDEQHRNFVGRAANGQITTKRELAMFLANIIDESAGLTTKEEWGITRDVPPAPGTYTNTVVVPGKDYHGRGYIQLTQSIVQRPPIAVQPRSGENQRRDVSFWYWSALVHNAPDVQGGNFGATTRAINGALECGGAKQARKRITMYYEVLKAFGLFIGETHCPNACDCVIPTASGGTGKSIGDPAIKPSPIGGGCAQTYTIKSGDNFWLIGSNNGMTIAQLKSNNPSISNPSAIQIGQFKVPQKFPMRPRACFPKIGGNTYPLDHQTTLNLSAMTSSKEISNFKTIRPLWRQGVLMSAKKGTNVKWPGAKIYYTIAHYFDEQEKSVIRNAINHIEHRTCIRFEQRTAQHDYISIVHEDEGCWSYMGRIGGAQQLNLARSGCVEIGVVIHEFLHALGFYHEQSRSDRNDYIIIDWNNIRQDKWSNYKLEDTNNLGTPYDYGSVMHYGLDAFALSSRPAFIPKVKGITSKIGQREGLSAIDVQRVNKFYGCGGTGTVIVAPTKTPSRCIEDNIPCGTDGNCYNPTYHACDNSRIVVCKIGQLPCGIQCFSVATQTCTSDNKIASCPANHILCNKVTCYNPAKHTCRDEKFIACAAGQLPCGKACYTTERSTCLDGKIRSCPNGEVLCNPRECYDPTKHTCKEGVLVKCQSGQLPCGTGCHNTALQNCVAGDQIIPVPKQTVCDGSYERGCGCHRGWCYTFMTVPKAKEWDTWCYTQRLGVAEPSEQWAACSNNDHSQCSTQMTCGNEKRYKGDGNEGDLIAAPPPTTRGDCDGSYERGCGCEQGWCYTFTTTPAAKAWDPWCWTQKLGVSQPNQDWAACPNNDHTLCHSQMTCGDQNRYSGGPGDVINPPPTTASASG